MQENNFPRGFRVLLKVIKNEELQNWFYIFIDFDKMKTITDVENHIEQLLGLKPISLCIREALLPKNETAHIISEHDIVVAKVVGDDDSVKPNIEIVSKKIKDPDIPIIKLNSVSNSEAFNKKKNKPNTKSNECDKNELTKNPIVTDHVLDTLEEQSTGNKTQVKETHPNSMELLFKQLQSKADELVNMKTGSKKGNSKFNTSKLTSSLIDSFPSTMEQIANNLSNNNPPAVKKKRHRNHKKKSKTQSISDDNNSIISTSTTELNLPFHGKHIRFCSEHENCSEECQQTATENLEQISNVVSEETLADNKETINDSEITTNEVCNNSDDESNQVIDSTMEDVKNTEVPVENQSEEVVESELMEISIEDEKQIANNLSNNNSSVAKKKRNRKQKKKSKTQGISDVNDSNISTSTTLPVEKFQSVQDTQKEESGKGVENGNTVDSPMEDDTQIIIDELTPGTMENVTDTPVEPVNSADVINDDEVTCKSYENDDWKDRLLNLANQKDIESKKFHRQCDTANVL